jgi:hypothetical protein
MGRIRALSCVALASMVLAAGCREGIDATLIVTQPITFNLSSGNLRQLPIGRYPVHVSVDGRVVRLNIEARRGEQFAVRIGARTDQDPALTARILSSESGQPFDISYTLRSTKDQHTLSSSQTSCRFETVETRCRTVYDWTITGESQPREVCDTVAVTRSGARTSADIRETSTRSLSGEIVDPPSGRALAQLNGFVQRYRNRSLETGCRDLRITRSAQ